MGWSSTIDVAAGSERRIEPSFAKQGAGVPPAPAVVNLRSVPTNGFLFRCGDARTHFFRIESGAICLYETMRRPDRPAVIEFLFPGDYVGLGFLETHHLTAKALLDTTLTALPFGAMAEIVTEDPRAQAKLAQSVEREFEMRRDELHSAGQRRPIERVAALLVTSARTNVEQGRPADLIEDSWRCGVIADLLQLTVDDLSAILVELERRDLIEATADGLRLTDIPALEALADGVAVTAELCTPRAPAQGARMTALVPSYRAA